MYWTGCWQVQTTSLWMQQDDDCTYSLAAVPCADTVCTWLVLACCSQGLGTGTQMSGEIRWCSATKQKKTSSFTIFILLTDAKHLKKNSFWLCWSKNTLPKSKIHTIIAYVQNGRINTIRNKNTVDAWIEYSCAILVTAKKRTATDITTWGCALRRTVNWPQH